jgi:aminodeoxyfutalosine deaminase
MLIRKFHAKQLFTGSQLLNDDQVLITDAEGQVLDIVPVEEAGDGIEKLDGWLSPGFINCHCHLELSHMKGLIPEKTGLVDFVIAIMTQRSFLEEDILQSIEDAETSMLQNGIVAVGDISNTTHSLFQKSKQHLSYYTFLELSGFTPFIAPARFEKGMEYLQQFETIKSEFHKTCFAAHAPYSVSQELWEKIEPYFKNKTTSLHNQETSFEDAFFENKSGDFMRLYDNLKVNLDFFKPSGQSSIQTVAHHLKQAKHAILVHDVFTKEADIDFIKTNVETHQNQFHYCLCVNANQYISNAIPPVDLFRNKACNIVIGTDSLASNHQLCILEELKTISNHFPHIPLAELLQWATLNGAEALDFDRYGSFEKGKKPGLVLIEGIEKNALTKQAKARRIL